MTNLQDFVNGWERRRFRCFHRVLKLSFYCHLSLLRLNMLIVKCNLVIIESDNKVITGKIRPFIITLIHYCLCIRVYYMIDY